MAFACEEAVLRPDGRIDVRGALIDLFAPGFPAMQDRMTVVFVMEWEKGERGKIPFRIDMVDAAGTMVGTIQGHTDVPAGDGTSPLRTPLIHRLEEVKFPHSGFYHFDLKAGKTKLRAFTLFVGEIRDT